MKIKALILVGAALLASSCDDFLDVNKNPNQTTISTPELVLTGAMNATASQLFFNQMGAFWAGQWCPSGDVSGFVAEKTYDFNNTYGTGIWTGMYDILNDYKYVMDASTASGKKGAGAIAKVMSTFLYHKLVDTYGNVPYTDALQGTTVIRPTYDNAQDVYEAIVEDLDEAIAEMESITDQGDNPKEADIIFGGDYEKWIQFANTLKLRLLIRQSEMPGRDAYITTEMGQISGGFLAENANANPGYLQSSGKQNPFWDNYFKSENNALRNNYYFTRSTAFLASSFSSFDARKFYVMGPISTQLDSFPSDYVTTVASRYKGVTYGDESSAAYSNVTSGIGFGILKSYDMPMTLFTAAESYFLQAEAVERGFLSGDADELYESGIAASFALLGVKDPNSATAANEAVDEYIASVPYDGEISTIIREKYIASVGYSGFEAWCDYRRTGFPNVPMSIKAIKDNIPVRLYYPNQELQTNAANVEAQGTIDAITTNIFWDVD